MRTATCHVEYVSDHPEHPTLMCDKTSPLHLWHHDPATGVRFAPWWPGHIFCLCGFFRHRKTCPLR